MPITLKPRSASDPATCSPAGPMPITTMSALRLEVGLEMGLEVGAVFMSVVLLGGP